MGVWIDQLDLDLQIKLYVVRFNVAILIQRPSGLATSSPVHRWFCLSNLNSSGWKHKNPSPNGCYSKLSTFFLAHSLDSADSVSEWRGARYLWQQQGCKLEHWKNPQKANAFLPRAKTSCKRQRPKGSRSAVPWIPRLAMGIKQSRPMSETWSHKRVGLNDPSDRSETHCNRKQMAKTMTSTAASFVSSFNAKHWSSWGLHKMRSNRISRAKIEILCKINILHSPEKYMVWNTRSTTDTNS